MNGFRKENCNKWSVLCARTRLKWIGKQLPSSNALPTTESNRVSLENLSRPLCCASLLVFNSLSVRRIKENNFFWKWHRWVWIWTHSSSASFTLQSALWLTVWGVNKTNMTADGLAWQHQTVSIGHNYRSMSSTFVHSRPFEEGIVWVCEAVVVHW